jgi:hypothetical protein
MNGKYMTVSKRTSTYIATIPMKSIEQVIEVKKTLEQIFGWVVLRGRNSDRKKVLGNRWHRGTQNDIPWRNAERIDIYLHPKNPNYQSIGKGKGIHRQNLRTFNVGAMSLGMQGKGFYDAYLQSLSEKGKQNPKFLRKMRLEKYRNKSRKLQEGDWGYIAQSILDFVEQKGRASFSEMKTHYDVELRGECGMIQGGSFIHHLHSLVKIVNVYNRRCRRLLVKDMNDKKYFVSKF